MVKKTEKRVDKLSDGVDELAKLVERLGKQVQEMAAHVAESRDSGGKGKKKKKQKGPSAGFAASERGIEEAGKGRRAAQATTKGELVSETKVLFVGGGEVRIHEDMESVRSRLASGNGDWIVLDRGGTEHRPICVNPATITLSGASRGAGGAALGRRVLSARPVTG